MKDLNETLEILTKLLVNFSGSQPTFRISQDKQGIEITSACSAFLKILFRTPNLLASLHNGVLSVNFFK
jgi:hypothetical protein